MTHQSNDIPAAESTQAAPPQREFSMGFGDKGLWVLIGLMVVIATIAQFIGPFSVAVGNSSIVLLPMIWALLMGVLVSGQRIKPLPVDLQHTANAIMALMNLIPIPPLDGSKLWLGAFPRGFLDRHRGTLEILGLALFLGMVNAGIPSRIIVPAVKSVLAAFS